jgi:roadblock/LC7 domain-containing protein
MGNVMSSSLDGLLKINGVVAAGEFGLDGSLVDYQANVDFSKELAQTTAKVTSAVTQVFNVLAESFSQLNGQFNFAPQRGWAYAGGDWSVAVGGNRGVFVKTADADYNVLFSELVGPR